MKPSTFLTMLAFGCSGGDDSTPVDSGETGDTAETADTGDTGDTALGAAHDGTWTADVTLTFQQCDWVGSCEPERSCERTVDLLLDSTSAWPLDAGVACTYTTTRASTHMIYAVLQGAFVDADTLEGTTTFAATWPGTFTATFTGPEGGLFTGAGGASWMMGETVWKYGITWTAVRATDEPDLP